MFVDISKIYWFSSSQFHSFLGSSGGGYGGSEGGLSPLAALIAPLAALALLGAASLISLNPTLLQLAVIQGKRKRRRRRRRWADNEDNNDYQVLNCTLRLMCFLHPNTYSVIYYYQQYHYRFVGCRR